MAPRRVGKLEVLGLVVYMNTGNGSIFFNEDGLRVRVHGNLRWKTLDGHLMRGQQTPPGSRGGQVRHDRIDEESDADSEDDENSSDTNTGDNDEEGDVARAINNSLQNGGGGAARANAGRPPVSMNNAPTAQAVAQTDDDEQRLIAQAIAESLLSSPAAASSAPAAAAATAPQCSICMDNIGRRQNVQALRCDHSFHKRCIQQWLRTSRTCPTCRERA